MARLITLVKPDPRHLAGILVSLLVELVFPTISMGQVFTGAWTPTGSMATARTGASAALLRDGRVLITGGEVGADPNAVLSSAEIYNPDTGFFSGSASMFLARSHHVSITMKDGRVLVTGGRTGSGGTNETEIYDPSTDSWVIGHPMIASRSGHSATLMNDGRVLIAGGEGYGAPGTTLEVFDPATGLFSLAGTLSDSRRDHAAVLLPEGRVLITGGFNGSTVLDSTDIYDPKANSVSSGPILATPRMGHSATSLLGGNVLIAAGNNGSSDLASAEIYDASTGSFVSTGELHSARSRHNVFLLPNNNSVLVVGGTASTAELYQPWNASFLLTGSPNGPRSGAAGAALAIDGVLLMAGGGDQGAELYGFANIQTDRDDYAPGQTVTIAGSGWIPGERVTLKLAEVPQIHAARFLYATATASGNIFNNEFSPEPHDLNARFYLTAYGQMSQAQNTFTDGEATVSGTVTNSVTSAGITGATVQCLSGCNDVVATTTGAGGSYSLHVTFAGNGPATVQVQASASGYIPQTKTLTIINNGDLVTSNFSLAPVIATSLSVSPASGIYGGTATLSAVLTTAVGGSPVSGKAVSFTLNGLAAGSAVTNDSGVATVAGVTLSGIGAGTYPAGPGSGVSATFATDSTYSGSAGSNSLTVNPKSIAPSITANSKVYDGTAADNFSCGLSGVLAADIGNVNCTGGSATFASAAVGTWTVTATGLNLTGSAAGNYTLSPTSATGQADITALHITGTFTASNRIYDGTNSATVLTRSLVGTIAGDTVSLTGGTASFTDKNAAASKTVTLTGATLTGGDAGNYALDSVATTTASITPLDTTGSFTASNKVYDRTDVATVSTTTVTAKIGSDLVTLVVASATFSDANAGTAKTVTGSGFSLSGGDAPNYNLTTVGTTTANITPASLSITATDQIKTYGQTFIFAGTEFTQEGLIAGDSISSVALTSGGAAATAPVGSFIIVPGAASGSGLSNYDISYHTGTLLVGQAALTITANDQSKTYGDTLTFAGTESSAGGLLNGDSVSSVTLTSAGAAATAAVTTYAITPSAAVGPGLANYTIGYVNGTLTVNKYAFTQCAGDGCTGGSLTITPGVAYLGSATATVSLKPSSLGGRDSLNTSVDINNNPVPRQFTVRIAPHSNPTQPVFFGTATATLTAPDSNEISAWATTITANLSSAIPPGSYKAYVYGDTAAADTLNAVQNDDGYSTPDTANFTYPTLTADFTVTKADQTITFAVLSDMNYGDADFTVSATATSGLPVSFSGSGNCTVSGSTVHLTGAGSCTVTASQTGDENHDAAPDVARSFNVAPKHVTGSFTADSKTYDGNNSATVATRSLAGAINSDVVTLTGGIATFSDKNIGTSKTVTLAGATLGGANAAGYILDSVSTTTADITPRTLTPSITANNKVYDGSTTATFTCALDGVVAGDVGSVSCTGGSAAFASPDAGTWTVTTTGLNLGGPAAGNYSLSPTSATGNAKITPRPASVTPEDSSKSFGEPDPVPLTSGTLTGFVLADGVTATYSRTAGEAVGTYVISASLNPAGVLGNYTITYNTAVFTIFNPEDAAQSTITANFNGTPINAGSTIWFNANFTAAGIPSTGATITLGSTIQGGNVTLTVPNAVITFSPSASCASTSFDSSTNTWMTTVPLTGSDEIFLSGLAFPVPAGGIPGGVKNVAWTGNFSTDTPGISIQWKWGAAVYSSFTDYNSLGVKPTHQNACLYNNGDHAGTPENPAIKQAVIGGARGGGGSNWTGSWSGTASIRLIPGIIK